MPLFLPLLFLMLLLLLLLLLLLPLFPMLQTAQKSQEEEENNHLLSYRIFFQELTNSFPPLLRMTKPKASLSARNAP